MTPTKSDRCLLDRVHLERIRAAAVAAIAGDQVHFAVEGGEPAYLVWRKRASGMNTRHVVMAGAARAMRAMLPVVSEVFEQIKDALVQESTI
jgi:hypothetical protein